MISDFRLRDLARETALEARAHSKQPLFARTDDRARRILLFFTQPRISNVVRRSHPHHRVHLHTKRSFDADHHDEDRSGLPLSRLDSAGREPRNTSAATVNVSPAASTISVQMKTPGRGGFIMGVIFLLLASLINLQVHVADIAPR